MKFFLSKGYLVLLGLVRFGHFFGLFRDSNINGLKFYFHEMNHTFLKMLLGLFERSETDFLIKEVKKGDVFFDVGANIGWYTLAVASQGVKAVAVEAHPRTFQNLKLNVLENQLAGVDLINAAATDKAGTLSFECRKQATLSKIVGPQSNIDASEVVEVAGVRLDELGLASPDVVKLDVEGAELIALRGMEGFLSSSRPPRLLMIELVDSYLGEFGCCIADVVKYLSGFGYEVFGLKTGELVKLQDGWSPVNDNYFFVFKGRT